MSDYTTTIGLEIHAELKTKTKMFCNSANAPHEGEPNAHICPVCMAFPGTLPTINKEAVHHVLKVGTALGGSIADFTEFDRKNYFYPDIPKGYQITQFKYPLVSKGELAGVAITRIHLEEDTARSQHTKDGYSLIDFNRAGVPLMELVTEPVIHDAKTASNFAQELQLLLRAIGASDANMEKGEMRVEANISVSKTDTLGTKVEVKNLNSFRAVEGAIEFEVARHIKALEKGESLVQETRGWDEGTQSTFSQRKKEDSHDYRYFPEPDLPKLHISRIPEFSKEALQKSLPELPVQKRERYLSYGLKKEDADTLTKNQDFGAFFDAEVVAHTNDKKTLATSANYLLSDVLGSGAGTAEIARIANGMFVELIKMVVAGELSSRSAKDILAKVLKEGGSPKAIAEKEGLLQIHDEGAIREVAKKLITAHPDVVAEIKAGKGPAIQFLVGQGMRETKGTSNPQELMRLIKEELGIAE
ncbi:Asp-tRNA(Asn)/Glu-tRNA(Gln) amidotransferase subunit GatB [Candidatus Kaiserbacteria bacterium CG10_big_fil_rev_8_21_14_0_10_45_20]|uniref:Aspartyl/glutamyl-tRNA(Asn/Gln) amidotransferase subunit B n=1 Tax=Candidatus Kaiserbacteria bacterium CG10_big_fil_rev_8_21_14_0_10_45_20 TaxID=1974607 RepID=A0A2H0UF28_9BACT|nr:MAG: Asp-tRNA(Asn)/Glu-tRNA(Gln) amidotransferase subunit GatB [Candidatus Kaiserbacteria bacterium CG10_big_fil_rev_8_21_14_0_10_45_20]